MDTRFDRNCTEHKIEYAEECGKYSPIIPVQFLSNLVDVYYL